MQTQYYESTINVSIQQVSLQDTIHRPNTTWLFSDDATTMLNNFRIYTTIEDVALDFAKTSNTYKFANIYFNNIFANASASNGALMISKLTEGTGATAGFAVTTNISANVDNFKTITNGYITITLSGTLFDLSGLNFKKAQVQSLSDIAEVINKAILGATVVDVNGTIKYINNDFGSDSTVAISQTIGGTGTDLSVASLLNVAGITATAGTNGTYSVSEITTKLTAQESATILPVLTTSFVMKEEDIVIIAKYVQNDLVSKNTQFLQAIDAGSSTSGVLEVEMEVNKNLHITTSYFDASDNSGINQINLCAKLCALQMSTNVFDPANPQELTQLNNKGGFDLENDVKVMDFDTFNNALLKTNLLQMEAKGFMIYRPIDAFNYDLKSPTRTISGLKVEFSNQVAIAQKLGLIRVVVLNFMRNNNLLNDSISAADIIIELRGEIFNIISQPSRKFIRKFPDYTGVPSVAGENIGKKEAEKDQVRSIGYYLTANINKNGTIKDISVIDHNDLGINKINMKGLSLI